MIAPDDQFNDRRDAGRQLARLLRAELGSRQVLILALPRGGVPVAYEIARALRAPLDVMVVRKLGAADQPEFALGALAPDGVKVINEHLPRWFLQSSVLEEEVQREHAELHRRELLYRHGREALDLHGQTVVLVDDGAATGASMRAAVGAAHRFGAAAIIVALPVAPADVREHLCTVADQLICLREPRDFEAVSAWYRSFEQVTDAEVCNLLRAANRWDEPDRSEDEGQPHHALRHRKVRRRPLRARGRRGHGASEI